MAGKVTLYVRDEQLWARARASGGPGGLSDLVDKCLQLCLARDASSVLEPSLLERSRRLLAEAEALVSALEQAESESRSGRRRSGRPPETR